MTDKEPVVIEVSFKVTSGLLRYMAHERGIPLFKPIAQRAGRAIVGLIIRLVLFFAIVLPLFVWFTGQFNGAGFMILWVMGASLVFYQVAGGLADDRRLKALADLGAYEEPVSVLMDAQVALFRLRKTKLLLSWDDVEAIKYFKGGLSLSFAGMLLPVPYRALPPGVTRSDFLRQVEAWSVGKQ